MIDAGAFDRRIDLIAVATARDLAGQPISTETLIATVAAEALDLRTGDIARAAGQQSVATGRYRIRYRSDLSLKHRVRVEGATHAITAIDRPDRRATLVLTLEQLV